jgi:hypothetical protein
VEAFRILNFMMAQSIQPNSYTLTALMKTCVKKEDWSRARELLIIGASQSNHAFPRVVDLHHSRSFNHLPAHVLSCPVLLIHYCSVLSSSLLP